MADDKTVDTEADGNDTPAPESDDVYTFAGEKLDVDWDGRLCIHISECTRAHGELFVSGRKPWGRPDLAAPERVADVVQRCPTGALSYQRKDGGATETPDERNEVVIVNNGPLYVRGDLGVDGAAEDMPGVRFRAALCRCGASKNKPFCDNSHEAAGFRDHGAVSEATAQDDDRDAGDAGDAPDGRLEIRRVANGPLLVNGRCSIRTAAGREAWRGTKAALCRCGASKSRPFCDGSHVGIGFEAD